MFVFAHGGVLCWFAEWARLAAIVGDTPAGIKQETSIRSPFNCLIAVPFATIPEINLERPIHDPAT